MQYCASCGQAMTQQPSGAFIACCDNIGYWAKSKPADSYRIPNYRGYRLYLNHARKPKGFRAAWPEIE